MASGGHVVDQGLKYPTEDGQLLHVAYRAGAPAHCLCDGGISAAATLLPSSTRRLYVEHAFH